MFLVLTFQLTYHVHIPYMKNISLHCSRIWLFEIHVMQQCKFEVQSTSLNGRILRLRWTRGRLEVIVLPNTESIATHWPAIHRPNDWICGGRFVAIAGGGKAASRFLTAHTPHLHWLMIFPLQNWVTTSQAARDGDTETILPFVFPTHSPQWEKGVYKWEELPL